jgi:vitellogenic carboxypeptidase-like protein
LNGDFYSYGTFYYNVTGLASYFNFLDPVYPSNPFVAYLNLPSTQAAIHVIEPTVYEKYNKTVEEYLIDDWMRSIGYMMPTLLDNYKVMIYNGQNDVILGPPPAENFIRQIPWSGQLDYLATKKIIWRVAANDTEPAGYVRQSGAFVQAIIRDAGHMVPTDQPRSAFDLITRFVDGIPYTN